MWSDPEIARWTPARVATNRAMAKRSRLGGWTYVAAGAVVIAISDTLRAHVVAAGFYLLLLMALATTRSLVCTHLLKVPDEKQAVVEKWLTVLYVTAALAWVLFLGWALGLIGALSGPASVAVIATATITAGGMNATVPRIRLMLLFGLIACPIGLSLLPLFSPEPANWIIFLGACIYFGFLAHIGNTQREVHWSAWQLTQQLEQRTVDLQHARETAESASKAKSDFLASMSHEIRTPLNGVLGMAAILETTTLNVRQARYLATLQSSGRTLLRIIDDILDAAKIEAGTLSIVNKPFSPPAVVSEIELLFREKAIEAHLVYQVFVQGKLPPFLLGDADRVKQILFNLLSNAFKFTTQGSVTLTVSSVPKSSGEVHLNFEIADTGIGIAKQDRARIFERFAQAGPAQLKRQGTGLGLSITRDLVELLGGSLSLETESGRGTNAKVSIPFTPAGDQQDVAGEPRRSGAPSTRDLTVLLAEDNPINQEIGEVMLSYLGHRTVLAESGRAAIAAYIAQRPKVILMDCDMPEMDGFEATRHIRQWEREHDALTVPIIALTAHVFEDIKIQCSAAGMNAYLSKPFTVEQLRQILDDMTAQTAQA